MDPVAATPHAAVSATTATQGILALAGPAVQAEEYRHMTLSDPQPGAQSAGCARALLSLTKPAAAAPHAVVLAAIVAVQGT